MSEATLPVPKRRIRRRWWIAAVILIFIAAYPATEGPAVYAFTRHWLPLSLYRAAFRPLDFTIGRTGLLGNFRDDYRWWWNQLAIDHLGNRMGVKYLDVLNGREIKFHYDGAPGKGSGTVRTRDGERYWWAELADGRKLVVKENRILWNGEELAEILKTAKLIEIEYFDGKFEIDINGHSVPLDE